MGRVGANKLQRRFLEEAGLHANEDDDVDEAILNTVDDSIKQTLAGQWDPSREFTIIIYGREVNGEKFGDQFVSHKKFNFSALGLQGNGKKLNTKKLDGRNEELQGRTSRSDNFEEWMTEKVQLIEEWFEDPENEGQSLTIAIYCAKGRHR